jgi:glycosyltransferase involved in cell wall biosynthesis
VICLVDARRSTPQINAFGRESDGTVTGHMPYMTPELAGADVVVRHLQSGSGTQLKIFKAFANRIPVVSTSLGTEGLNVLDGVHLLIADSPEEIAEACGRLHDEPELRQRPVAAAQARFRKLDPTSLAREHIRELVDAVVRPFGRVP